MSDLREKVFQILDGHDRNWQDSYPVADEIISLCQPQWISVEKRLPITEKDMGDENYKTVEVIIFTKNGNVFPAEFEAGNTISFWSKFKGYYKETVISWQPLPEKPNE